MSLRVDQGVILIGGRGSRLGTLTQSIAKPMLEVGGRPFVEHVISQLARFGVRKVILLAGHYGALPEERYNGRRLYGADISVLVEPKPLGTGGALRFAAGYLDRVFFLMNGDTFFDTDLVPLIRITGESDWSSVMLLRRIAQAARYGHVRLDSDGKIREFREKPEGDIESSALVNAGTYLIRRDAILPVVGDGPCSIETFVFPRLAAAGALRGIEATGYFIDIGVPQSLETARLEVPRERTRPAAFLDRDGVLNIDRGYTHRVDQFEWIPGAPAAVRMLNKAGYYVFVVTNQAGVARGYYTEHDVDAFHAHMQELLLAEGAHIDAFYYCPHHPQGQIRELAVACQCRKPLPGLLEMATRDWYIDRGASFLIGDKEHDLAAAAAFGIRGIKFDAAAASLDSLVREELTARSAIPAAEAD